MRSASAIIYWVQVATLVLLISCHNRESIPEMCPQLDTVEQLIDISPDSAYSLLCDTDTTEFDTWSKARWIYQKTRISSKLMLQVDWVEQMEWAAQTYENVAKDDEERARLYYYVGYVARDNGKYTTAVSAFLRCISYLEEEHHNPMYILAWENLFFCYQSQNMYADAVRCLDNIIAMSKEADMPLELAWAYYFRSNLNICQSKYDLVSADIDSAYQIASSLELHEVMAYCLHGKAVYAFEDGRIEDALVYSDSASIRFPSIRNDNNWCFMRGRVLFCTNAYDSAYHFLKDALHSQDIERKYWISRYLFDLSKIDARFGHLATFADSMIFYRDIYDKNLAQSQIKEVIAQHQTEVTQKQQRIVTQRRILIVGIVVLLLVVAFWLKSIKDQKQIARYQEDLRTLNAEIHQLKLAPNAEEKGEKVEKLIQKKLDLCVKVFVPTPLFHQLKIMQEKQESFLSSSKREELIESLLRYFVEVIQDIESSAVGMKDEDCIQCILTRLGFNNKTIGACLGLTTENVRKRKSRIKTKLTADMFAYFFNELE